MVQLAFQDARFARAAVIAVIMVMLSAIVVVPYLWSIRREV
jgi:ABC-type sugar transport system permease subunit